MAQGVQRAVVQIRDMVRFFGTVGAEQTALDRVKVKLSPVVFTAARAGQHVRHIARQRQGAQLIDGFELRAGIVALTDHIQAVEKQAQLGVGLGRRGGKLRRDLRHVAGQSHPLNGRGDAVEHLFDLRSVHKIVAAPAGEREFRVAEQPCCTEQGALHPQTAAGRRRHHAEVRRQDRQDPVCLAHLDLPQHKARCCHLHIRPPVLCFVDFCTSDSRKCCLSAQSAASRPPFCPCRSPPWLQCSRGGAGMLAEWGIK